jgi:putative PEP-CTERM system histidine kinase
MLFESAGSYPVISLAAVIFSAATGVLALVRDIRSPAYRAFAFGMAALTAELILSWLNVRAELPGEALRWCRWRLNATAFIPGSWLLFSLSYARENYAEFSKTWKWGIVASFAIPVVLASLCWTDLTSGYPRFAGDGEWITPIGWAGYVIYVVMLLSSVLILANLEKTLLTSFGAIRWQIKFTILGVGILFAARVFTSAQVLLFSATRTDIFALDSVILLLANLLLTISAIRNRLRDVKIFVSQDILHGSLTLLVIGIYLLLVGVIAKVSVYLGISQLLLRNGLIIFIALLGVVVLLLSEKIRYRIRRFIHLNLKRPYYDYQKIWTDFTKKTASLVDINRVCAAIAKTVADTFTTSRVSIWLIDENLNRPSMAASTVFSPSQAEEIEEFASPVLEFMRTRQSPLDIVDSPETAGISSEQLEKAGMRYCAPLTAGGEFIGMLTLGSRTGGPFSIEDYQLLKTFADQAAGLILNHKLFDSLGRAREVEAMQAVSAFFAHDLKNVASTLSLTLTNLPVHYDNPEFRADALKIMSKSVEKIRTMCSRLSALNRKFELNRCECDLNELVSGTVSNLNLGCSLVTDLCPVPKASLDSEQIRNVILNLILNASESVDNGAEIVIATGMKGPCLLLSVTDRGCGMSRKFIRECLFHPFKTTKERGSGIGLYQSKMIVEAHGGRIEVLSREGFGSTFTVLLPLSYPDTAADQLT